MNRKVKAKIITAMSVGLGVAVLASALGIAIGMDAQDEFETDLRHYCQMRAMNEMNPDIGWPKFRLNVDCDVERARWKAEAAKRL